MCYIFQCVKIRLSYILVVRPKAVCLITIFLRSFLYWNDLVSYTGKNIKCTYNLILWGWNRPWVLLHRLIFLLYFYQKQMRNIQSVKLISVCAFFIMYVSQNFSFTTPVANNMRNVSDVVKCIYCKLWNSTMSDLALLHVITKPLCSASYLYLWPPC
jgi:hypothetical protein